MTDLQFINQAKSSGCAGLTMGSFFN